MEIRDIVRKLVSATDLAEEEAYITALEIMSGNLTNTQIGALLVALAAKGETVDEITGFARAMRVKVTPFSCNINDLVDTCGTGGDHLNTFNISTVSAIVAAGAGCRVAKHGNRSVSSRCGSADVLTALGINVEIPPECINRCLDETGVGFLFAPAYHPAMRFAAAARREIGIRTIFNILGPLTNPAGANRQLLGVYDENLMLPLTRVLAKLGSKHCLVVHGEDGLDEITITAKTNVCELRNGDITTYCMKPEDFGFQTSTIQTITGGEPSYNAALFERVLKKERGPLRDITLMNAGAAIYISGRTNSISQGIQLAAQSIDSGRALNKLEMLRQITAQLIT